MTKISLSARSLAETRFVISPVMQAAAILHPQRPSDLVLPVQRLPLLEAVRSDIRSYVPDFLTPALPAAANTGVADVDAELHRIATTPAATVARQLSKLIDAQGIAPTAHVRHHLEQGERAIAQQAADEMDAFFRTAIAPRWPGIIAAAEDDIERRARLTMRQGLGAALCSLHPGIRYDGATLSLASPAALDTEPHLAAPLILFPSPLASHWLLNADPWQERPAYLIYPAGRTIGNPTPHGAKSATLAPVIGHTRLHLLTSLEAPRTTTELADSHRLAPSTVSHHLKSLLQARLVSRTRTGKRVYYQRTPQATALIQAQR
ncbi:helix-turn-helix domain-containing protein [Streptomyces sp. NPDC046876]|uniref:ArsR/SmtB family transcription factor n=1 Tax=Streptomyces sp. NPDC046876 TaxID=3155616 RepID=UPI00340A2539